MPSNSLSLISVILPVYNGEKYLTECIESVLNQTYRNFEFIIVDDASTDSTPQILKEFALQDTRIKVMTHAINQKQTIAANTAIKQAEGKYIARMDADDVALANRFQKQIDFLEDNPKIGMVGSWTDIISETGDAKGQWETASASCLLKWNLLFGTSFAHSSVMMRKVLVEQVEYYQSPEAEDYDLWSRLSRVSEVANIPEVLQQKRVWSGQLALKVPTETRDCVLEIMQKNINHLLKNSSLELETIRNIRKVSDKGPKITNTKTINYITNLFKNIYKAYIYKYDLTKLEKKIISRDIFQKLNTLANWKTSNNSFLGFGANCYLALHFPKLFIYSTLKSK